MPSVSCPVPGCTYTTPDLDAVIIAALLTTHATTHSNQPTSVSPTAKIERVRRPTVTLAGTSEDWKYFLTRWIEYKTATKITGRDAVLQLLECCDEQLRRDLTRSTTGMLAEKSEDVILASMKSLAVREENVMVARDALNNMNQDPDEPIRSFGARLKGQAGVCKYVIPCPSCSHDVDYTEQILCDVLGRGISDPDIQLELLGHTNQDMCLEEVLKFVETKEAGKRSATRLIDHHQAGAVHSQYRRGKRDSFNKPKEDNDTNRDTKRDSGSKCGYCGTNCHSTSASRSRQSTCPAYNHKCGNCQRLHHFDHVCRSKDRKNKERKPDNAAVVEESSTIFNSLCSLNTASADHVDHHCHNKSKNVWKKSPSPPQPFLDLSVRIVEDDYSELGFKFPHGTNESTITIPAMADTGCQSCLIGYKWIQRFNLSKSDLIPVRMKMDAANGQSIKILGAIVIRIAGINCHGSLQETKQFTYVTNDSDKFYLSKSACVDLGIVSPEFPMIGANTITVPDPTNECSCPQRSAPPPLPTELPYPPTEENRERLEQWLLNYYKSSTFNVCEHQPLPLMSGPPMKLMIDENAEPTTHHSPIPVPIHWQEQVKADLDRDVALGVIEPVPIGEPVTWCHRMVVCPKKSGKPRRCVDFQALNKHATRETHHTQSPFHQVRTVPHHTKKTVSDAWNGYHSVPLCKEDRHYTTYITPWGRYRYCTLPQGYITSGDGYSRRFDAIVSDFPDKIKVTDDSLLWATDIEKCFFHTCEWLDTCGKNGIIQNPSKFKFAHDVVEFAGFEVTPTNVRPAPSLMRAIADFPVPQNITDIRSWFGLVNQVAYTFSMTDKMLPLRELLKPQSSFQWSDELDEIFAASKSKILSEIEEGVRIFDKSRLTCIATDWSKNGVGFWLLQKHCLCEGKSLFCCRSGWKVVLVGSRFTHPAESRYAPVEGEALAVAHALDKCRHFVLGCKDLIIAVDHKPLLGLFTNRSLEDIPNNRLRNLKERTLRYRFTMQHIPGLKNRVPDALSRHPSGDPSPEQMVLPDDISFIAASSALNSLKSTTWEDVRQATTANVEMRDLVHTIESGLPEHQTEWPQKLQVYHQYRDQLSTVDGVALYKDRVIIPPRLRPNILSSLHAAHHGVTSMNLRAESSIFWPGLSADIVKLRQGCQSCDRIAPSQPSAPPKPLQYPDYPFQQICGDFFHYAGHNYLVCIDRYSNWPIVEEARNGAKGLIDCLRRTFVTYGIPDEFSSDGGPELCASSTSTFLRNWGVHHRISSVAYPHSNCRAEVGVKTVKRMLTDNVCSDGNLDTDAFQKAMLQYRNTPNQTTKLSPAICLFGRPIKDFVPILPGKYLPHPTWVSVLEDREKALRRRHMAIAERLSLYSKQLNPLCVGDQVRIQNQTGLHPLRWDKTGSIIEVRPHDQYVVRIDGSRRVTLRNRKFLRKFTPVRPNLPLDQLMNAWRSIPPASRPPITSKAVEQPIDDSRSTQDLPQGSTPPLSNTPPPQASHDSDTYFGPDQPAADNRLDVPTASSSPPYPSPVRRSTRERRQPSRFEDYVMN